jgi:hypothetical protein
MLMDKGFDIKTIDNGNQYIVSNNGKTAKFWPSTGMYKIEGETKYKDGIYSLISDLEG